jgi:nitrite reductase (NADH) small subunit
MKHVLFPADELTPGSMRVADLAGLAVVVIRTPSGRFHVLRDSCSHAGARLSDGALQRMVTAPDVGEYRFEGDQWVVRCPWHGYEFEVESGRCPADPRRARVRVYTVSIEEGNVVVER